MKRQSQGLCSITTTVSIDHLLVKGFDAKQGSTDEDQHWNFAPGGKRFFIINKCSRRQMVPQHLMCLMYVLSISVLIRLVWFFLSYYHLGNTVRKKCLMGNWKIGAVAGDHLMRREFWNERELPWDVEDIFFSVDFSTCEIFSKDLG